MNANDNRRPMSPLGKMLFEAATDMAREGAALHRKAVMARIKPPVLLTIRRPSKEEKK